MAPAPPGRRRAAAALGAAAVLVALILVAAPAHAQVYTTKVEFVGSPAAGSVVGGVVQIRVRVSSPGSLERASLRLESEDGYAVASQGPPERSYDLLPGVHLDEISFSWDTRSMTPLNGRYRWVARASSLLGSIETVSLPNLKVNNEPLPPRGVTVRLDGTVPVVSWAAAPEGDVTGWRVWRAPAGSDSLQPVGTVPGREFRDQGAPAGGQTYAVNAIRRSPVTSGGIASQLSGRTQAVEVPAAAPTPSPVASPSPSPKPSPTVRGTPQPEATTASVLPFVVTPSPDASSAPVEPSAAPPPSASPRAIAAGAPPADPGNRLRLVAVAALALVVSLLAWRFRRKLLTGR